MQISKVLTDSGGNENHHLAALFQLLAKRSFFQDLSSLLSPSPRRPKSFHIPNGLSADANRIAEASPSTSQAAASGTSKIVTDAAAILLQRYVTVRSESQKSLSRSPVAFLHILSIPKVWSRSVSLSTTLAHGSCHGSWLDDMYVSTQLRDQAKQDAFQLLLFQRHEKLLKRKFASANRSRQCTYAQEVSCVGLKGTQTDSRLYALHCDLIKFT